MRKLYDTVHFESQGLSGGRPPPDDGRRGAAPTRAPSSPRSRSKTPIRCSARQDARPPSAPAGPDRRHGQRRVNSTTSGGSDGSTSPIALGLHDPRTEPVRQLHQQRHVVPCRRRGRCAAPSSATAATASRRRAAFRAPSAPCRARRCAALRPPVASRASIVMGERAAARASSPPRRAPPSTGSAGHRLALAMPASAATSSTVIRS